MYPPTYCLFAGTKKDLVLARPHVDLVARNFLWSRAPNTGANPIWWISKCSTFDVFALNLELNF